MTFQNHTNPKTVKTKFLLDLKAVILSIQPKSLFSLLEEVNLHITQSLLQFCDLLFPLTHFPLQLVLQEHTDV